MIEFSHEKEREILLHYANLLDNADAIQFLQKGSVDNKDEVRNIAKYYWEMVDKSVEEDSGNTGAYENMEKWLERIYTSFHIYFNNIGMEEPWESEIP